MAIAVLPRPEDTAKIVLEFLEIFCLLVSVYIELIKDQVPKIGAAKRDIKSDKLCKLLQVITIGKGQFSWGFMGRCC